MNSTEPTQALTDEQIDKKLATLRARKAKLLELQLLQQELSELELDGINSEAGIEVTIRLILKLVGARLKVPAHYITGRARTQYIADARFLVWHFCRKYTAASYSLIGKQFKRDHGSVMHGINAVTDRMEVEPSFKTFVAENDKAVRAALVEAGLWKEAL